MSSQYPVMQLSYKTKRGQVIKLGDRVLVVDGGIDPLGLIYHIEDSSDGKTVKVILVNEVRNLLNAFASGQRQAPFRSGKTGYYHIEDYEDNNISHGLVFSLVEGLSEAEMQDEYRKLKAWHDEHGSTGGTGDKDQRPNPGEIPFPPWKPGEGKEGGTGGETGGGGSTGEHPGKDTGEGQITRHPADTREPFGEITKDEKKEFERANPGQEIKKGPYTDPDEVNK